MPFFVSTPFKIIDKKKFDEFLLPVFFTNIQFVIYHYGHTSCQVTLRPCPSKKGSKKYEFFNGFSGDPMYFELADMDLNNVKITKLSAKGARSKKTDDTGVYKIFNVKTAGEVELKAELADGVTSHTHYLGFDLDDSEERTISIDDFIDKSWVEQNRKFNELARYVLGPNALEIDLYGAEYDATETVDILMRSAEVGGALLPYQFDKKNNKVTLRGVEQDDDTGEEFNPLTDDIIREMASFAIGQDSILIVQDNRNSYDGDADVEVWVIDDGDITKKTFDTPRDLKDGFARLENLQKTKLNYERSGEISL